VTETRLRATDVNELAIKIEALHKSFKYHLSIRTYRIIRNLSFHVNRGEIFGFIGPNGAGKTTTIKLIMGLIFADKGKIEIFGKEPSDKKARERIGFLPENPCFYEYLTGYEFLDFYGQLFSLGKHERKERANRLLSLVGLSSKSQLQLRKYSRGMLQRLGFAQALLNDPDLLVLDEPMSSLDPIGRREMRDIILDLKKKGKTIFFSSHILQDAEMICDRVAIIKEGEIKLQGKLSELLSPRIKFWDVVFSHFDPGPVGVRKEIISCEAGDYLVRLFTGHDLKIFLEELKGSGGNVISIVPHKETLEDLFMNEVAARSG
jgi:ABC-2 type transport system ATP-binding protein